MTEGLVAAAADSYPGWGQIFGRHGSGKPRTSQRMENQSPATEQVKSGKVLNYALWIVQILLALGYVGTGLLKLLTPADQLALKQAWVPHFEPWQVKAIGALELLGAIGLIVPSATRIMPKLTVLAALGLVILMIGAASTHIRFENGENVAGAVVFGVLTLFVAWGRARGGVIQPKS